MRALMKLFGKSPFAPLRSHMAKALDCVERVGTLFQLLEKEDVEAIEKLCAEISLYEHEADQIKNGIRENLPSGMFLAIERHTLLEILTLQDALADRAEDIAMLVSMYPAPIPPQILEQFQAFLEKNLQTVRSVNTVVLELEDLMESSFGGAEASKVKEMIKEVAVQEHEVDSLQHQMLRCLFSIEPDLPYKHFYILTQVLKAVAELSNLAEKLGNRVRTTLDLS